MASRACKPETIYESNTVDIQHCPDCKMIHLTMGSITVRMSEHHFTQFAQDMSKGLFEFNAAYAQPSLRVMM
ncbi:MAG TPA: hypothetical protein EYM37_01480 [Methylophaga aminisulfidivorans]|jgi:hypothetical protein|uniref:Uncharacterized protein n=2 Tax=Methylophaga TaxID=40222 RepID=F5T286_9GAMM|nr:MULTISPECIES: hypothetical protein [Methylophaga]EGL53681.1 hypothetical protein MAMP_01533 [Methylophaga aminisulfidivorans MP]WVI85058.1 hypothetical protein VSX76_14925 [Methylophaga thalassica]GLQ00169.1 hypothetical protein GCM10007891_20220 [Methylophaga thalassica]HIC47207.1 hypothetical protein [Methylophaga sp.]HIM38588.1 hypothetical protein [Methylophaga aminisulfidivorans]